MWKISRQKCKRSKILKISNQIWQGIDQINIFAHWHAPFPHVRKMIFTSATRHLTCNVWENGFARSFPGHGYDWAIGGCCADRWLQRLISHLNRKTCAHHSISWPVPGTVDKKVYLTKRDCHARSRQECSEQKTETRSQLGVRKHKLTRSEWVYEFQNLRRPITTILLQL